MFEVILAPEARLSYESADLPLAKKLKRCFAQLEQEPQRHNNIKRLTGLFAGKLRYRIGDWRVIYKIDRQRLTVIVLLIAHRSEIYE